METVGGDHRPGRCPEAGRRVPDLGALKWMAGLRILAPRNQHLPRGQERRGVLSSPTSGHQAPGP